MISLRRKTVDQIIAPITKIIQALDIHEDKNVGLAAAHSEKVVQHQTAASEAQAEAARAAAARAKIAALIS